MLDKILLALFVFPLAGALGIWIAPTNWAKAIALFSSLVTFVLSIFLFQGFDSQLSHQFQGLVSFSWIESLGVSFSFAIDGLSFPLVLLTQLMMPVAVLSSWKEERHPKAFMASFLGLGAFMTGTFLATDLVLFYVFWEAMLIPMILLIGVWGSKERVYAALKFFLFTFAGSLFMLLSVLAVLWAYKNQTGQFSAQLSDLIRITWSKESLLWGLNTQELIFWGFTLAFLVKVPVFPLHTWLPDAHVQAPTGGSILLAAVLLKMGTYGLLRFSIPFGGESFTRFAPLIAVLCLVGVVYGALVAFQQTDMKKLVAYSSVSHLGLVVLGICSQNSVGLSGAVIQNINHGLSTGALFFLVGFLYDQRHSRLFSDYGGLASVLPWYSIALVMVACSSMAVPGLNGFVGELLILLGAFQKNPVWAWVAVSGVVLGAVYTLTLLRKVLFGPVTQAENQSLQDLTARDKWVLGILLLVMFGLGVAPGFLMDKVRMSLEAYWGKSPVSFNLSSETRKDS